MKNVMIVDGADNCAYDCFQVSDDFFQIIFPAKGQDIEFIDDLLNRHAAGELDPQFNIMWTARIKNKSEINGIDGILFYELPGKKFIYPNKRDSDIFRP